jgi:2-polyprenyl-6-methoxyphenol hydroxylase-like FAD-dependent oxidoreductase
VTGAYVLAGELAQAATLEGAFASYERRLRPLIAQKQASAANVGRAFAPKTRLGLALRNTITRAFELGPLAKLALGPNFRDDFDLPDYDHLRQERGPGEDSPHDSFTSFTA